MVGAVVVIGLVGLALLFGTEPERRFSNAIGPPPADPEARKAWISENVDNMNIERFVRIDYEVPSWKELEQINRSLEGKKNYPKFIKAVQTYGTLPNLLEVLYFGDVLDDIGVNTQFIHANYWFRDGELALWYLGYDKPEDLSQDEAKRALVHNILLAKQQGLAVILFPDYVQLENNGMLAAQEIDGARKVLNAAALTYVAAAAMALIQLIRLILISRD